MNPPRSIVATLSQQASRTLHKLALLKETKPEILAAKLIEEALSSALIVDGAVEKARPKKTKCGSNILPLPRDRTRPFSKSKTSR